MDDEDAAVEYSPFDLSALLFEFFYRCSSLDAEFDSDTKSSYNTVCTSHNFMTRIEESVEIFQGTRDFRGAYRYYTHTL